MLLSDIEKYCSDRSIEVVLTLNLPEESPSIGKHYSFPIIIIQNEAPQGFAANHNQAFSRASGQYFCVMNPDVRLNNDPFQALLTCLQDTTVGVAAPVVVGESGELEDSARQFPTPLKILCKAIGGCKGSDYVVKEATIFPDWIGGMFMLFPRAVFAQMEGFDQRYFLYYEDVDMCGRLKLQNYRVAMCPNAKVVHLARRESRRRVKYLKWHLTSMMTYFFSRLFLKIFWVRLTKKLSS